MSQNSQDFKIHVNQTMAMQSILLSMSRGYVWHCSGEIKTEKANGLIEKFNERYGILKAKLSLERRATRASRKAELNGEPHPRHSASFVIHPVVGGDRMRWVLLATGPLQGEQMQDGKLASQRLQWGKYQMSQIPKTDNSGVTWTWRLTREAQNEMEGWFVKSGRSNKQSEFEKLLLLARNYPMFAGVRKQVQRACERGLSIWNRQHPDIQLAPIQRLPVMVRRAAYANPPMTLGGFQTAHLARLTKAYEGYLTDSSEAHFISKAPDPQADFLLN